jgi:predicted flap endonuclease-1-like 5' DNA nuclease
LRQELADAQELLVRMSADRQDLVARSALLEAQLETARRELETAKRTLAMAPMTSPAETQALAEALAESVAAQKRLMAERDALAQQAVAAPPAELLAAQEALAHALRKSAEAEDRAARLQEQMEAVRQDRDRTRAELAALQAAVGRERDEAAMLRAELDRRAAVPEAMVEVAEALVGRDPLEAIPGLGAAARRALRAGGIRTYADLASATTERIRQLVGPGEPGQPDPATLIASAAELLARERG